MKLQEPLPPLLPAEERAESAGGGGKEPADASGMKHATVASASSKPGRQREEPTYSRATAGSRLEGGKGSPRSSPSGLTFVPLSPWQRGGLRAEQVEMGQGGGGEQAASQPFAASQGGRRDGEGEGE